MMIPPEFIAVFSFDDAKKPVQMQVFHINQANQIFLEFPYDHVAKILISGGPSGYTWVTRDYKGIIPSDTVSAAMLYVQTKDAGRWQSFCRECVENPPLTPKVNLWPRTLDIK